MMLLAELMRRHRGLTVIHVEQWIARGLLRPPQADIPVAEIPFSDPDAARVRLLYELVEDLQFDEDALQAVVGLIDQVHDLRHQLAEVMRAIARQPADVQRSIATLLREPRRD